MRRPASGREATVACPSATGNDTRPASGDDLVTFRQAVPPDSTAERTPAAERLSLLALLALALLVGFGDIAQTNPLTSALLFGVHALLPLSLVLVLTSLVATSGRTWPTFPRSSTLALAAWLLVQLASAALAPGHREDALATLGRSLSGALLAVAVATVSQRQRQAWLQLQKALALGGLVVAVLAVAEATGNPAITNMLAALHEGAIPIGDVPRVAASLSHPNATAMLLELCLPLLIAWAWSARPRTQPVLVLAAMLTFAAIILTFSRAGIATAVLALALLTVAAVRRHQSKRHLATLGLVALVLPLTLGWSALADPGLDHRMLAGLDESSPNQPPRTQFWSIAIQMASDHPVLGVGPDNFRWLFDAYAGTGVDNLGIHAHNQYLEALADTGLLGSITLLTVLAAVLWHAARAAFQTTRDWPWRAALLASLSSWLVHALVDDFERFWPTSVAFWLIVGLSSRRASD